MVKGHNKSLVRRITITQIIALLLIANTGQGSDATVPPEQTNRIENSINSFNSKRNISSMEMPRKLAITKRILSDKSAPTFSEFTPPPDSFLIFRSASDLNWLFKINKVFVAKKEALEDVERFERIRSPADLDGIIEYDPNVSPNAALILNVRQKLTKVLEGPVDASKPDWNDWFWRSAGFDAFVVDANDDLLLIAGKLDSIQAQEAQPIIISATNGGSLKIPEEKDVLAIGKIVEQQKNFALVKIVLGKKKATEIPSGSRVILKSKK